jgi:hypothetical protein
VAAAREAGEDEDVMAEEERVQRLADEQATSNEVDSCWWIPVCVLIGGFLFSLVDSCSHQWMHVLSDGFLFSIVDSCSP